MASKKRRCGSAASKKKTCKSYFNLHPQGEEIAASTELCKLRAMKIFCVFKMLDLRRAKDGKTKQNLFAYRWWLLSCASEANAYLMEGKSRNNVRECRLEFCASFKVTFNWDARLNAFRFHWNSQCLNVNCCARVWSRSIHVTHSLLTQSLRIEWKVKFSSTAKRSREPADDFFPVFIRCQGQQSHWSWNWQAALFFFVYYWIITIIDLARSVNHCFIAGSLWFAFDITIV